MEIKNLIVPTIPTNGDPFSGMNIEPINRLKTFSDTEFEEMVNEWAYSYLQNKYESVHLLGGSGDKGRDIVAYYDSSKNKSDIYQCKHYNSSLAPSDYWIEFGKLCYYTYIKEYNIPTNYYIVTSQGIGQKLRSYIDNYNNINKGLIDNWDKHCKNKITREKEITLDTEFRLYIENFDFSIVKDIEPIRLLDQYSQTKWFKYRFGGGIPKRPKPEKLPVVIGDEELRLEYIRQLMAVYKEYTNGRVNSLEELKTEYNIFDHFTRQRLDFYCAQSLKRFSRDEFVDDPYEEAKDEIYRSVIDICTKEYSKSLDRVNQTTGEARKISLDGNELGKINPSDKSGMCHELVNDNKLNWVNNNE